MKRNEHASSIIWKGINGKQEAVVKSLNVKVIDILEQLKRSSKEEILVSYPQLTLKNIEDCLQFCVDNQAKPNYNLQIYSDILKTILLIILTLVIFRDMPHFINCPIQLTAISIIPVMFWTVVILVATVMSGTLAMNSILRTIKAFSKD